MDILFNFTTRKKVNMDKCNIMFSGNTHISVKNHILAKSWFKETSFLGTYLWVPITGKSTCIKHYFYLIEKVPSKLASLKSSQLSFVGRVTLAKVVIEAFPMYNIMIVAIHQDCIQKIHKCQRVFISGDNDDKKNLHSVRWSIISKEKTKVVLVLETLGSWTKIALPS